MLLTSKGSAVPTQMHAAAILFHGSTGSAMFRQNGSHPGTAAAILVAAPAKKAQMSAHVSPRVGEHAAHKKEK